VKFDAERDFGKIRAKVLYVRPRVGEMGAPP
jgi:hypothetical protein